MHSRASTFAQRARAELHFRVWALRVLVRPLVLLTAVWLIGALLHRVFGTPDTGVRPPWGEAFFVSYNLLFLEHIAALPTHPIGRAMQYLQPLFGVFLLAEGVFALALTMFRKDANQEKWMEILANSSRQHVILCGLGNVGFRVLESLVGMDERVFAVELNPDAAHVERARELGAEVLVGDARSDTVLASLNVQDARAVIVATDDDLANLEIAMDVRERHADVPVVMRLFDQRLAHKVQATLGISATFSTSKLAAPLLAAAALDPSCVGHHQVGDTNLVVMELRVTGGSTLDGQTVDVLRDARGINVVARDVGAGWMAGPRGSVALAGGDRVQVLIPGDRIADVHALNR